jgi:hypothetical protein
MPQLNENTQRLLRDAENGARRHTLSAWNSFSNFALRDNVLEVAVGLMYTLPLLCVSTTQLTILQFSSLFHRLRELPCNRRYPPPRIPLTIPLPQPRREVRDPQTRPQLQRNHLHRLQHQRPSSE